MENRIISIKNLFHSFSEEDNSSSVGQAGKKLEVLRDINFEVGRGEFLSIVGPSGGGKSTLLRILAGFIQPTRGIIEKDYKKLSMVFQNFAIFPWLTVVENIEFGLKMSGISTKERARIVQEKIKEVGLVGFEHKYPKELSGGMRQRVGIARALALNPDVLLMDEPFSSLDTFTAEKLRQEVMEIWLKYKMTVVMVTHLVEEAVELSDRIVVLSSLPGTVKFELNINLTRPRNKRSVEFFSLVDKVSAQIE